MNTRLDSELERVRVRLRQAQAVYDAAYAEWEAGRLSAGKLYEACAEVEALEQLVRDLEEEEHNNVNH